MSRLVRLVNSYWQPAQLETNLNLASFASSLFSAVSVSEAQQNYAFEQRNGYASEMSAAIAWKEENEGDTSRIREVAFKYRALRDAAIERVTQPDGTPYTVKSWAAACWRASHTVKEDSRSSGSLAFNLFPDEIMAELKENPDPPSFFEVYNVHKQQPNHWSKAKWKGRTVQIRAC
ncbi:hypothetical protein [Microcoleus sp. F4-D5]|uniref:hypothetical protein n=1 Tax=Microcoleus sp. F4-D5 TaxID=2818760 RepID=UPI002FD5EB5F